MEKWEGVGCSFFRRILKIVFSRFCYGSPTGKWFKQILRTVQWAGGADNSKHVQAACISSCFFLQAA